MRFDSYSVCLSLCFKTVSLKEPKAQESEDKVLQGVKKIPGRCLGKAGPEFKNGLGMVLGLAVKKGFPVTTQHKEVGNLEMSNLHYRAQWSIIFIRL